jgi:hypothetical protein
VDAVQAQELDATQKVSVGRQALRREVNERIRALQTEYASAQYEVFCECGRVRCNDRVVVAAEAYDELRRVPGRSLVKPAHAAQADRVVGTYDGFVVVESGRV